MDGVFVFTDCVLPVPLVLFFVEELLEIFTADAAFLVVWIGCAGDGGHLMLIRLQLLQSAENFEAVVSEGAQILAFDVHLAPLYLVIVPLQMGRVFGFRQK